MKRLLFVCTQNACRSQMAEAICNKLLRGRAEAFSAGVAPATVHPLAIEALSELGIETSGLRSKHMDEFKGQPFDLVVTVCSNARESCPHWAGQGRRIHFGLEDPARAQGQKAERLEAFRRVRDRIVSELIPFLDKELKTARQ
jgi:arsenate reductase